MEFVPFIVLATMVMKLIDWARLLVPDNIEDRLLIPISWAIGALVALLFSASPLLAGDIVIWGEHTLADADVALVVIYGIAVASAGGVIHDAIKSRGGGGTPVC